MLPDVRDGLTREERLVLLLLRELGPGNVPMTLLYGRVVEKIDMSVEHLQAIVGRLTGKGSPPAQLVTRMVVASPIGALTAVVTPDGLAELAFDAPHQDLPELHVPGVEAAIEAYFEGDLAAIDAIRVAPRGGTPFQRQVWDALRTIPAGSTISYAELAIRLGQPPGASRAVGSANGANPIAIVVPCHRVVAAGGKLGGYAGGLERKRWLLDHEQRHSAFRLT